MNNRVTGFVMIFVAVAVYLNVGWAIGTYYHNYIFGHEPQTFWQHVWGGNDIFDPFVIATLFINQITVQIIFMFLWPFFIALSLLSWIVFIALSSLSWVVYGIFYFLWLIFTGGIAKLLGVG